MSTTKASSGIRLLQKTRCSPIFDDDVDGFGTRIGPFLWKLINAMHCDTDFDEAPTAQTMVQVKLSSEDPISVKAGHHMNCEYVPLSCNPVPTATEVNAPNISTNTSVSTTIAQDAPSTSHSLSSSQVHPPVFPQEIAAGPTIEDTSITQADLHPSVNPVAGEPSSAQSTSGDVSLAEPNQVTQPPDHLRRWTKDHPLDNNVTSLLVLYLPENS
ncbi:hypothetical protein Tco_0377752 [Tanacetum coccineum]